MKWGSEHAATQIYIDCFLLYQYLSSFKVLLTYRKTKRSAIVFVKDVGVCLCYQESFQHPVVAFYCSIVQRCPLSVIDVVDVKNVVTIVL